jgi:hypothetical protein
MSFEFDPNKNLDRSEDGKTPKTLKALEVREDSLVESPADPKLEPPINPRDKSMVDNPYVIKACP